MFVPGEARKSRLGLAARRGLGRRVASNGLARHRCADAGFEHTRSRSVRARSRDRHHHTRRAGSSASRRCCLAQLHFAARGRTDDVARSWRGAWLVDCKKPIMRKLAVFVVLLALALGAVALLQRRRATAAGTSSLTVYCAANLKKPVETLAERYRGETGTEVRLQF